MKRLAGLSLTLAACLSSGGGGGHNSDFTVERDASTTPERDLTVRESQPDFARTSFDFKQPPQFDFTVAQKSPVGAMCTSSSQCGGVSPQCYSKLPGTTITAAGGYCSNANCASDSDCGESGFCGQIGS